MINERQTLEKNSAWELTELQGKCRVSCKWFFTIKHNPNGTIPRYKATLAAKEFTQAYGIDYPETSPALKLNSVSILSVADNFLFFFIFLKIVADNFSWPLH